ncbi:FAD-binding oxidoreductase [Glycomyces artemisiae]|uniref:FAD/FMN-containing dehydrogenase n=1 Tax=Glycomyces artemisiae TaxID=1076443 RepID=A0A2T0UQ96_9ACTN|nr:FAD-binding oxidoreductase [Glycomyces artemisiae]PRY59997.1 FAD/FMN-containing dehydrogenase [Glycomyces artemisiae]
MNDLAHLRRSLDGDLVAPGHPDYDTARRPVDPAHQDARPRFVIRCASAADVARGLAYARDTGTPVVPRGGGHCFSGRSSTTGIVLDLQRLRDIAFDGDRAEVGAGARLAQVYTALHARGRTIPAGCGATVGIAGLALGGGIGLLGRVHGLTSDRLVAARVVLADGRTVDCDAEREPDLFWALRGAGGGQFGVVVSLAFDTVPEPIATRFALRWRRPPHADLIAAWQEWAPDAPDAVTADLALGEEAVLFGASLLDEATTRELLQGFCDAVGAAPEADVQGGMPFHRLKRSFEDLDAPSGAIPRSRSAFFSRPLRPATIDALTAALSGGRRLNFTAMGGAYGRVPADATAFAHRGERFMLQLVAPTADPWLDASWAAAYAESSKRVYPNFPDLRLEDWPTAYHGANLDRLRAVKRRYDPDRCFAFPQSL